jgi:hypothetical protein
MRESLELEQARVYNEENRRLFPGVFILQLLEQRYLTERYPIQDVEVSKLKISKVIIAIPKTPFACRTN